MTSNSRVLRRLVDTGPLIRAGPRAKPHREPGRQPDDPSQVLETADLTQAASLGQNPCDPPRRIPIPRRRSSAALGAPLRWPPASWITRRGSVPASSLVPSSTVMGRSAFSRSVTQGTPSTWWSLPAGHRCRSGHRGVLPQVQEGHEACGGISSMDGPRSMPNLRGWSCARMDRESQRQRSSRSAPATPWRRCSLAVDVEGRCSVNTP